MSLRLTAALAALVLLASAAASAEAGCDQACGCESACDAACGCEECGGCDCLDCCDWNCGPVWEFRASYLYLKRDSLDSVNIFNDFLTGEAVLNGDDFQFDYESGVDVAGSYHYGCGRSLEARYVWIDDWQDTVNLTLPPGDYRFNVMDTKGVFIGVPSTFVASYQSEFQSGEINLRREAYCRPWLVLFAGFRYLEINESLDAMIDGDFFRATWRTQNHLYGFQIGAEGLLWESCSGWRVQGSVRAGIYNNDGESNFDSAVIAGASTTTANAEDDEIAFAGEAELLAEYQLNCTWSVHAGYRVMLIDGLAIAANQLPATQTDFVGPSSSTLDLDGTLFAHGLVAGVGAAW